MLDHLLNKTDPYPFIETKGYDDLAYSIRDCRFFIVSSINMQPKIILKSVQKGKCIFSCYLGDQVLQIVGNSDQTVTSADKKLSSTNSFIQFNKIPEDIQNVQLQILPDCIVKLPQGINIGMIYHQRPVFNPMQDKDQRIPVSEVLSQSIQLSNGYNTSIQYTQDINIRFNIGQNFGLGKSKYFKQWNQFYICLNTQSQIQNFFKGILSINGISNNINIQTGQSIYTQLAVNSYNTVDVRGSSITNDAVNITLKIKTQQD